MKRIMSILLIGVLLFVVFNDVTMNFKQTDEKVQDENIIQFGSSGNSDESSATSLRDRTRSTRDEDIVTVMFDDAHYPAFTADPKNSADEAHGGCPGGYSDFADVLRDPKGMENSHPGHKFETDNKYEVISLDEGERITDAKLEEVDVLVVPCSMNEYKTSEIDAIERYVKGGGGLFLIADHSNFATAMDDIAYRFHVRWAHDVVTDSNDYSGPYNYWIIWEDRPPASGPADDNMPANDVPGYQNDKDEIWEITKNSPTVQFYCSNAYIFENPAESRVVIRTDTDGSSNFNGEPACLAIPNGNCTGAGKAVFITDSNVFGDDWDNWFGPDGDCDEDGKRDFWDEHNAEFGLGVIDWLAPGSYEVALIPGEKDPDTGLPKPLVYIYEPGETHSFEIEVWNLGLRNDIIELEIPEVPGNWTATIDKTETEELGTREKETLLLTVTAPMTNITDGEFAIINVTATSRNDPVNATDTIHSTNVIIVDLGFNVNWAVEKDVNEEKKTIVDPGRTTVATLGINNIGNINDTYEIDFKGVPSGWDITVDTKMHPNWVYDPEEKSLMGISLSSYHFEDNATGVSVFFTPPLDAKEGETAIITAMGESYLSRSSDQDAKGKHDDDLIFEVSAKRAIEINCEEPVKYIDPGKTVNYIISVQNNGNSREEVDIQLGSMMADWAATVDSPSIILQARQRKTVTVTMWAPEDALEGSRCVLEIEANMPSMGKVVDSLPLTAIVTRYSFINATLEDQNSYRRDPGEKVSINISVGNPGNGITMVYFGMAKLPEGWDFEFFHEGLTADHLILDPYQTVQIRLDITVSKDALSDALPETPAFDPYQVVINISGEENHQLLPVLVQVNRKADITVYTTSDMEVVEPGAWALFTVCVRNDGNAWDEIRIGIEDIPLDRDPKTGLEKKWNVFYSSVALVEQISGVKEKSYGDFSQLIDVSDLSPASGIEPNNTKEELLELKELVLRIPRDGIAWITITAETPYYALARDTYFNVTSTCLTSPRVRLPDIGCTISIRNAELSIVGDILISDDVTAYNLVSVMVRVKNSGEIRAEDVQVQLYEDGSVVATMPIRTILPGNTQMVAFTWKVPNKERCNLKVVVDPDDLITEKNTRNNMKERSVTISGSSIFLFGISAETIYVLLVIFVILGILLCAWFISRKRLK